MENSYLDTTEVINLSRSKFGLYGCKRCQTPERRSSFQRHINVKAAKNKFYRTTSVGNQVSQYLALKEKMANKENPVICFGEKHFGDYYLDLLGEDRYRKMKELSAKLSSSL